MHGQSGGTSSVVPSNVDAGEFSSSDRIVVLEGSQEMFCMLASNKLYTKVINNEGKCDGAPTVAPKTRGGWCLVVSVFVETRSEEIVG